MSEFIMLVGLPASGKSTICEFYKNKNYVICSSDKIREELYGNENIQGDGNKVFSILHKKIKDNLINGKDVVYDATNINYKRRIEFLKGISNIENVHKTCILLAVSYQECLERNQQRERKVPEEVITKMYKHFYIPQYYEGWDEILIGWGNKTDYNLDNTIERLCEIPHNNPYHSINIGCHCDKAYVYILSKVIPYLNKYSYIEDITLLGIATLMHDIGKEFCKSFNIEKGYDTYYQHHLVGAYESLFYSKYDLKLNDNECLKVANLIQWHMEPYNYQNKKESKQKEFINMIGENTWKEILLIHEADRNAH